MLRKLLFLGLFLVPFLISAQSGDGRSYKFGIGLRAGYNPGGTLKYMMDGSKAIEGILHFRHNGFVATGLFEKHAMAFDEPGLRWFYGVGGHVGFYGRPNYVSKKHGYYYYEERPSFGVDGILGIEYVVKEIPFAFSLDYKPYVDIYYPGIGLFDGALSVRYIF